MTTGKKPTLVGQLRGATRLVVQATRDVAGVVQDMQVAIGGGPAILGKPLERIIRLATTPTYATIRGVTGVVGAALDGALEQLEPLVQQAGAERGMLLAVLNGVVGDHLAATGNPLAMEMQLCHAGNALELKRAALKREAPAGSRLLVLVHGSAMDDAMFRRNGHDHGEVLSERLGLVPIHVRYNSGLHISENGRQMAALLQQLVDQWPSAVEEIVVLAFSMGGLVARSAYLHAEREDRSWRNLAARLVMLGTPHHGAPLERGGNWVHVLLPIHRYSAPLARVARLRSAGITDMRYGYVLDEHWQGRDRFERHADTRGEIRLPAGVKCFAVAGTTATSMSTSLPGDGMVPVDSALGRHADPALTLRFPRSRQFIALGHSHLDLLDSQPVLEKVTTWLKPNKRAR